MAKKAGTAKTKKHWFSEKKSDAAKKKYLEKHPNSVYHPSRMGPPKPAHIQAEQRKQANRKSAAKSKSIKAVQTRIDGYKVRVQKANAAFVKLGQRPKDQAKVKGWEDRRKLILETIKKLKIAIRGATSKMAELRSA